MFPLRLILRRGNWLDRILDLSHRCECIFDFEGVLSSKDFIYFFDTLTYHTVHIMKLFMVSMLRACSQPNTLGKAAFELRGMNSLDPCFNLLVLGDMSL